MKLHLDRIAFEQIIDEVAKLHGIRRDVLEKDYYVTLLLLELSRQKNQGYAYFKGGTALYKALRSIRRFSEDIDLTVFVEDCPSHNQVKKRLEQATLKYESMPKGDTLVNERGSITCEYLYDSIYELDIGDSLQRFGKVKVEGTSFTVSEPTEKIEIAPHLYELCNEERRKILREYYNVAPFILETISLERIFIDKVFAAEFYFERKDYGDVAKHIYDLTVLLQNEKIKAFLSNTKEVIKIVGLKRKEELIRKGGVAADMKVADFAYFTELRSTREFEVKFNEMQKIYVFDKNDELAINEALNAVGELQHIMNEIDC